MPASVRQFGEGSLQGEIAFEEIQEKGWGEPCGSLGDRV